MAHFAAPRRYPAGPSRALPATWFVSSFWRGSFDGRRVAVRLRRTPDAVNMNIEIYFDNAELKNIDIIFR
jgi:hypothetical protein